MRYKDSSVVQTAEIRELKQYRHLWLKFILTRFPNALVNSVLFLPSFDKAAPTFFWVVGGVAIGMR